MRLSKMSLSGVLLSVGAALILPSLVFGNLEASPDDASDKTLSPYFFVQSDDPADQMPLKSTAADVTISGVIADIEVTQVYKNEGKKTLEAIYLFPGSTRAAVYAMRMTIGKRTIEAKIQQREKARQAYEQALSEGKTASLLEQQRPNVFQMNVGNILPGDEITVKLNYTELLVPEEANYEFVYPTTVGPRYSNTSESAAGSRDKWVSNPYLEEGKEPPFTFAFTCRINGGMPIARLASPSHEIDVEYTGKTRATITLKESAATVNRDVVIRYCLAGNGIESGLLMNIGKQEDFFLLMLEPPQRVDAAMIVPREYLFILDVSGSMDGFPIEVEKTLMKDLLGSLREGDFFNVQLFAGGNTMLSERSLPVNAENIKKAMEMIDRQRGGGGTELMPALKAAMSFPKTDERISRSMIILTDGFVDVEKDAFDYISSNLHKGNVFTFGIGSSVNRFLIEGMARAGMGEPFIVLNDGEAKSAADRFRNYIDAPVLTDITVTFNGLQVSEVEPPSIPDLFAEKPVVIFGKYSGTPRGTITVSGAAAGKPYKQEIRVSEGEISTKNNALRYLWARHRIVRLADMVKLSKDDKRIEEITQLGLTYNLLTDYTSFVAVDTEKRAQGKPQRTVKQPLPLPQGVSNAAVGNQGMERTKTHRYIEKFRDSDKKIDDEIELLKKPMGPPVSPSVPAQDAKKENREVQPELEALKKQLEPDVPPMKNPEAQGDKRQQLMEKIRKLEAQRMEMRKGVIAKSDQGKPAGKSLDEILTRYEKLLSNYTVKKSERCADVIYTLAGLYYDKGRDEYIKAREDYERGMEVYGKDSAGPAPVDPAPDYSQALGMYERLIREYPDFPKLGEAYYQMGTIYLLRGDTANAKEMLDICTRRYPRSPRASGGHLWLSDLAPKSPRSSNTAYTQLYDLSGSCGDNDTCIRENLERIHESEVDIQTWEMVHYRKAELYYHMGEFDKALNLFYTYVEKCDSGLYPKREFRDMALEFMAICFTDMENGNRKATNFFKKTGSRPYEPYVMYTIGMKYRAHGRNEEAIAALSSALEKFPDYKDAPAAREALAEMLYRTGGTHYTAQRWEKARECFKRVDELYRAAAAKQKKPILEEKAIKDVREKLAELEKRK